MLPEGNINFKQLYMENLNMLEYWDAKRLIKEYAHIAWVVHSSTSFDQISIINQIKLKRIASVICAYLNIRTKHIDILSLINSVFEYVENREVFQKSPMTSSSIKLISEGLASLSSCYVQSKFDGEIDERFREQLFWMVLRYRIHADDLLSTFDSIQECNKGGNWAISICNCLYNPKLELCNDQLDSLLALLLGEIFEQDFTLKELIDKYNYPTTTDEELLDSLIGNA